MLLNLKLVPTTLSNLLAMYNYTTCPTLHRPSSQQVNPLISPYQPMFHPKRRSPFHENHFSQVAQISFPTNLEVTLCHLWSQHWKPPLSEPTLSLHRKSPFIIVEPHHSLPKSWAIPLPWCSHAPNFLERQSCKWFFFFWLFVELIYLMFLSWWGLFLRFSGWREQDRGHLYWSKIFVAHAIERMLMVGDLELVVKMKMTTAGRLLGEEGG